MLTKAVEMNVGKKGCEQYDRTNELKALKHFQGKLQGDSSCGYITTNNTTTVLITYRHLLPG